MNATAPRWENYILEHDSGLTQFWGEHFGRQARQVLFVLARGFGPRMCLGLEQLLSIHRTGQTEVCLVEFDEGVGSPSRRHRDLVQANLDKLNKLASQNVKASSKPVRMWSEDRRRVGSYNSASLFGSNTEVSCYEDIFVDVSAMPRSIYFPLVSKLLFLIDSLEGGK